MESEFLVYLNVKLSINIDNFLNHHEYLITDLDFKLEQNDLDEYNASAIRGRKYIYFEYNTN